MPNSTYYSGMTLADAVRKLAEHHYDRESRHISAAEHALLVRAAEALADVSRVA